jgi:hypothetical protein
VTKPGESELSELLADALTSGDPGLDLLLEYVRDPSRMDDDSRSTVEGYLEQSPAHRDRLVMLRRIADPNDPPPLGGVSVDASSPTGEEVAVPLELGSAASSHRAEVLLLANRLRPKAARTSSLARLRRQSGTRLTLLAVAVVVGLFVGAFLFLM